MKYYIAILLTTAVIAAASNVGTPPEKQVEGLRHSIVVFAEGSLEDDRAVLLGICRNPEGKTTTTTGPSQISPDSPDWAVQMRNKYRAAENLPKIVACAIAYCTMEIAPGEKEKMNTLVVELYHREGISLLKYYPYRMSPDHKVIWGKEYSKKTENILRPKSSPSNAP